MALHLEHAIRSLLLADATLSSALDSRVYPGRAPQSTAFPYVILHLNGGDPFQHLTGTEPKSIEDMDVHLWSRTWDQARSLGDRMRIVLDGYRGTVTVGMEDLHLSMIWVQDYDITANAPQDGTDAPLYLYSLDIMACPSISTS